MLRSALVFLMMTALSISGFAQMASIKGIVTDGADKTILPGATVSLLLQKDSSVIKNTVSNSTGFFEFTSLANDSFIVRVNSLSYQEYLSFITIRDGASRDLGELKLDKQGQDLAGVTVVGRATPVIQKGDTSQFSASSYKVNPDATTEDLIKKMPGITVAKDGTVTAQGETVRKVTIDGKDFFGDDATAALKNLPSEVVDKIQVFDRLSDQAQLTGVDDGNSVKAINVVTKSGIKNGQFGRVYAGYGTDERYSAGGNVSFFNGDRRLSFVGNFNNINQQNFGSQDLLGLTSSGGRGGGGGMGGGWGGNDNFSVGQSRGISRTNAFGINFSNKYGPKVNVTASYFYNDSKNTNQSLVNTETYTKTGSNLFTRENGRSVSDNYNHRFNMRFEYKIDSNNSIFIIPSVNLQGNKSNGLNTVQNYRALADSVSNSIVNSMADRSGYNIRNNIMYRHSFAKRGRSISLGFNTNFSRNTGETITDALYRFFDNGIAEDSLQNQFADNLTNGQSYSVTVAYTEPLGKKGQLQLEYSPTIQKNDADQQTFRYDGSKYSLFDSTLSNRFDNTNTTNRGGVTYRWVKNRDEMFSIGVNFQSARLESQRVFPTVSSVNQSFFDFLPNAMWRKKLSPSSNIRVFYRSSVNFPSVNQLQDVVNLSNPLRVSSGNPGLKQSNTQFIAGRYSYTNSKTAKSFFANLFLQTASNYISNATFIAAADSTIQQGIVLKKGSQLSKPVNLDGYRSLRSFFTYSMPIKAIKTTLNLNTGFSYSKLPGLVNYANTTTDNYVYNAGIVLASNISEYVDFNINYTANFNDARNSFNTNLNNRFVNQSAGVALNLLSKNGWFVQNDVANQTFSGLSEGLNQSFWLWNAAIGKKFLKNNAGELKLSVFDLLKQNQSISRTVTEAYIQDVQSEVLQQYFMLTFTYNLKNFGTAKPSGNEDAGGRRMGGPRF
ncbi:MAG: TonB-dependent receptor [Chitinophagaceae bacterium]|nr:MAG: TonB-dependent receptor [Chitinophagaceae bacterium]